MLPASARSSRRSVTAGCAEPRRVQPTRRCACPFPSSVTSTSSKLLVEATAFRLASCTSGRGESMPENEHPRPPCQGCFAQSRNPLLGGHPGLVGVVFRHGRRHLCRVRPKILLKRPAILVDDESHYTGGAVHRGIGKKRDAAGQNPIRPVVAGACCPACDSFFLQPSSPIELNTKATELTTAMTCWKLGIEFPRNGTYSQFESLEICQYCQKWWPISDAGRRLRTEGCRRTCVMVNVRFGN